MSAKAGTLHQTPIHPPTLLRTPSKLVIVPHFPIQLAFAITVEKAQGQTLERVIVALSERNMTITNFRYSCLYVAMSRVREAKHLRILLSSFENRDDEWQSLQYLEHLKRDESIQAFFSGFNESRRKWTTNKWNPRKALKTYIDNDD